VAQQKEQHISNPEVESSNSRWGYILAEQRTIYFTFPIQVYYFSYNGLGWFDIM
jgi:hypothetical protein